MKTDLPKNAALAATGFAVFLRNVLLIGSTVIMLAAIGWAAGKAAELVGLFPYRSAPYSYFTYTAEDCAAYARWRASGRFSGMAGSGDPNEGQYFLTDPCKTVERGAPGSFGQALGFGGFLGASLVIALALVAMAFEQLIYLGRRDLARKRLRVFKAIRRRATQTNIRQTRIEE